MCVASPEPTTTTTTTNHTNTTSSNIVSNNQNNHNDTTGTSSTPSITFTGTTTTYTSTTTKMMDTDHNSMMDFSMSLTSTSSSDTEDSQQNDTTTSSSSTTDTYPTTIINQRTTIATKFNQTKSTKNKSQREILIDKLNERVMKITLKEIEKYEYQLQLYNNNKKNTSNSISLQSPPQLAPEFIYAQQPMTFLQAGYPIYQLRSQYLVYAYSAFAIGTILYCISILPILVSIISLITIFLAYDLYSGILHVVFDHPSNIAIPILGQPCLEFQWHHSIPDDIVRKSFIDVCGDLNIVILIMIVLNVYLLPITTNPIALLLGTLKLMMAYYGQYSHKSAHCMGKSLSYIPKLLQQNNFMISVKDHMDHHKAPYNIDYCLIGICNPIIDFCRTITTNNTIWLSVFVIWSIFDLYIISYMVTSLVQYLQLY